MAIVKIFSVNFKLVVGQIRLWQAATIWIIKGTHSCIFCMIEVFLPKNWAVCSFQKFCNPTPTLSSVIYCFHVGNSCCLPSTGNPVMTWFESVDQSSAVGMCVAAPISNELCNQWDNILNTIYALKHMFGVDTKQWRKLWP